MKKERQWVFSKLDLLIPWSVCVAGAVLCILATVYGVANDVMVARVISIATGVVFLGAIPIFYFVRSILRKYDYKTSSGLYVVLGKQNRPDNQSVEQWLAELQKFWSEATWKNKAGDRVIASASLVQKAIDGVTVFFRDEEKLSIWGRLVRAYTEILDVVIGWTPSTNYVHSLFLHEISHLILNAAGEPWDEEWHHQIFQQTKLGE